MYGRGGYDWRERTSEIAKGLTQKGNNVKKLIKGVFDSDNKR